MRFNDLITLLAMIGDGPTLYKVLFASLCFIFLCGYFIIIHAFKEFSRPDIGIILLITSSICIVGILLNDSYLKGHPETMYQIKGISRSNLLYMYKLRDNLLYQMLSWQARIIPNPYPTASTALWEKLRQDRDSELGNRILFVVNESWGKPFDKKIEADVLRSILTIPNKKNMSLSELNFIGATVDAEMKEMCHLRTSNFNMKSLTRGFENCLPNQLKRQSYSTYSLHGGNSLVYDGDYWYHLAGLDHRTFFEQIRPKRVCHSFPGACDSDLISYIYSTFSKSKKDKIFYYWLTLNTHYPYDLRDLDSDRFDCLKHNIEDGGDECRNLKLQTQFFDNLAFILSKPNMVNIDVYVVGDHEPPVLHARSDKKVFKPHTVSFLHFRTS